MNATPFNHCRFRQRLRLARETQDLTQLDVAKKSGLQAATISHFECGQRLPSLPNLLALCVTLNCRPDWLMGLTETEWRIKP